MAFFNFNISLGFHLWHTRLTFYKIVKSRSTGQFQSLPYLVALFSSMMWLYYGLFKKDATLLITINSLGSLIELVYIILYISYADTHARILTLRLFWGMNVVSFIIILLATQYAQQSPTLRVKVVGWICVSISVGVFAAPLSIAMQVIRTKSVRYMPIALSVFLTLSALVWGLYGLFLNDKYIACPNVLGLILRLLQIALYAVYRNTPETTSNSSVLATC